MFGAIFVGMSGLQAYSKGLQQISNNISNLNSLGFKTSKVSFSNLEVSRDIGGISLQGGSQGGTGGVSLANTVLNFGAGELQQTSRDLDIAVDGTGLLVLLKGTEVRYTRTGSFEIDKDGFLVLAGTEWRLATLDDSGRAVAVSIDPSRTNAPVKTTKAIFADNLSSSATSYNINDINVFDTTGVKNVWQASFTRPETSTDWTVKVTDEKGTVIGEKILSFVAGIPSAATAKLAFEDSANGVAVEFDFSTNVTSFSSGTVSTLRAASVDGHGVGAVTTITVNADGKLELSYSNDQKKQLGAVALATFRDLSVLRQETAGLFAAPVSADVDLLASEDPRVGTVKARRLEASNVDLSREFGDLIIVQRGYQASSQVISVANDMIQQLFGIRGQG